MKKRLAVAAVCWAVLSALLPLAANSLYWLLSGSIDQCTMDVNTAWNAVRENELVGQLWLIGEGLLVLMLLWCVFGTEHIKYKSNLYQVAPGIRIPRPEGQGQYGTAWWMTREEIRDTFAAVRLRRKDPVLQELVQHGYDDWRGGRD